MQFRVLQILTDRLKMSIESTSSETSDEECEVIELLAINIAGEHYNKYLCKQPYKDEILTGAEWVQNVLHGNSARCPDMFRMTSAAFMMLGNTLKERGLLCDTRYVSVEEQLGVFLYTIGHNEQNRIVADRFQHSGETISRHFNKVLKAVCKFSKTIITPPNFTSTHPYITSKHDKYYLWFENCVGAIDGTHVSTFVPADKQIPYRGRKTQPTQNVMCACDFDMCFTFVLGGWEGTANDSRVFMEAITSPNLKFPYPP